MSESKLRVAEIDSERVGRLILQIF